MTHTTKTVKKTKNTPKLRFAGFSGAWEEKRLGEVADVRDGTHDSPKYHKNGYPFITSKNLRPDGTIDLKNVSMISAEDFKKVNKRSKVDEGDILFGMIGTIGNPVIVKDCNFAIKNVALIKERETLKNSFLFQYLKSDYIANQFYHFNAGGTQKFLSLSIIRDLKIPSPQLPEQKKIADFLGVTDTWIENLRAQKENLESYKKGIMQKIFPSTSSGQAPQIRFKDEKGKTFPKWEEKKLGELGEVVGGGTPDTAKAEFWKGTIPWVSSSDLEDGSIYKINTHRFITENAIKNSATHKIPAKSVLMVSRVGVGKIAIANIDVCTSQDFQNITPFQDKTDAVFLAYYLSVKVSELLQYNQGTSIKGFTKKDLQNLCLNIPALPEQQKIANFLTSVDKVIESKQQQITQAETWKKGLMQGLFV